VTGRDTQLGYRLGYRWSEKGDFELEMGVFSAEGGDYAEASKMASARVRLQPP